MNVIYFPPFSIQVMFKVALGRAKIFSQKIAIRHDTVTICKMMW